MQEHRSYEYPASSHKEIGYPYRVWIFSITITSLLWASWLVIENKEQIFPLWMSCFMMFGVLTAMSVPSIAIYMLIFWQLIGSGLTPVLIKFLLMVTALLCIWLTAFLLSADFLLNILSINDSYKDLALYSSVIFISSFVFSLKEK